MDAAVDDCRGSIPADPLFTAWGNPQENGTRPTKDRVDACHQLKGRH